MLRAFVDEVGYEYEALREGATEDEIDVNVDGEILVAAALDQAMAVAVEDEGSDDEDTDDEAIPSE
ncbi:hypothetical protein MMC34_001080 [Xylographa carneopallida]|nr:hypothetical protein [Xylographa carneopallida]